MKKDKQTGAVVGPESLQSDLSHEFDICLSIYSLLALIPSEGNFNIPKMFLVLVSESRI